MNLSTRAVIVALTMLLSLLVVLPAGAADRPPSEAAARAALAEVRGLLGDDGAFASKEPVRRGRDASLALRDLFLVRAALQGDERREADAYFARPTDGAADPTGNGFTVPAEQVQVVESTHFRIHYVTTTDDAATAAYAGEVAAVFEEMWMREIDQLGWSAPALDAGMGGDDRTTCTSSSWATPVPTASPRRTPRARASRPRAAGSTASW